MANWSTLKTAVANIIKANGNQEITGQLLQNALNNIITNVGENATFVGIATLDTNPGAPDGPVFYLATTAGTYPNFNGIEVQDGEAVILLWNNGAWTKKASGFATQEKLSRLVSEVNNNTRMIKALNGYNTYSEEYKVFGEGISYDFAILLSNFYKKGTSFSLNVTNIDGASVMLRKRLADNVNFAPTILTVNEIGSGEVEIPEDGKYALLFYKTIGEKSDTQHEYSVTYTVDIKNTNIQDIENDILNVKSLEKENIGYKHLHVQEKGEVIEQFSIVNSNGVLRRFFASSSDSVSKAAPIYANTSIDAKNGIICDSYIDRQIGSPNQMHCVAVKILEGEKHIYGKVGKISFPESQEDRPFVLVRFYSAENANVGQFFMYENEENSMAVPKNASYLLVFEYLSLKTPINGGEYVFNNIFIYTDISNKVLDSKIKGIEELGLKQIPDIGKAVFDNYTFKAIGNGITYDTAYYKDYKRDEILGNSFFIGVGEIEVPEGGDANTCCVIYREETAEGTRITNKLIYANTEEQEIKISPYATTIIIIIYMSINNQSVKNGEYIFNNLSVKIGGKYNVFSLPKIEEGLDSILPDWLNKNLATYGDSVTAINNGDFVKPFGGTAWGNIVASYFGFSKHFGRGVGSQKFAWGSNGGAVVFVNEQTGAYVDRNNSYNYDNYVGNVDVPSGSIAVRGCSCSWLRITKMFPESIKDSINVVTIMYHNDASDSLVDTELEFIPNDATDIEWKNSNYYNTYGGDYNIKTVRGGIASTIMKMQAWMPNAVIVLCTPISGRFTEGQLNMQLKDKSMQLVAEIVRDMSKLMSIPMIDVYATCGINGLNRTRFITDGIHPYSAAGNKMVARAIIGGLKAILPL